jgi:hypothetical protein
MRKVSRDELSLSRAMEDFAKYGSLDWEVEVAGFWSSPLKVVARLSEDADGRAVVVAELRVGAAGRESSARVSEASANRNLAAALKDAADLVELLESVAARASVVKAVEFHRELKAVAEAEAEYRAAR